MNTHQLLNPRTRGFFACLVLLLAFALSANAQRVPGDVGLGMQIGQPTGVTVKVYSPGTSVDFLAAWDWDDFFFLNVHAIYDVHLNPQQTVHFYYGPGGFIGIRDRGNEFDDEVVLGASGNFGFDFMIQKFEIFLQATPRLSLHRSTDFDMGGGVGFRIYL